METFLNEHSLNSQFASMDEFTSALVRLNRVLTRLNELPVEKRCYFHGNVYHGRTIGDRIFSSCLKHIPDKSVRLQFTLLLRDRLHAEEWSLARMHDDSEYVHNGQLVTGTSIAEHAERRIQQRIGFLLTFAGSPFAQGRTVAVSKVPAAEVMLDSVEDEGGLRDWNERHPELGIVTYDPASADPPPDHQTVLGRRSRFIRTKHINQGRNVYLDRSNDRYCCVDNEHFGGSAHLEVFNAHGSHVGEARLDGTMIPDSRDATKQLPL